MYTTSPINPPQELRELCKKETQKGTQFIFIQKISYFYAEGNEFDGVWIFFLQMIPLCFCTAHCVYENYQTFDLDVSGNEKWAL